MSKKDSRVNNPSSEKGDRGDKGIANGTGETSSQPGMHFKPLFVLIFSLPNFNHWQMHIAWPSCFIKISILSAWSLFRVLSVSLLSFSLVDCPNQTNYHINNGLKCHLVLLMTVCNDLARNFYWSTFFGQIFSWNDLAFIKSRILRKEYFRRSRFCVLDFLKLHLTLKKNTFENWFMFENRF